MVYYFTSEKDLEKISISITIKRINKTSNSTSYKKNEILALAGVAQ